jgi:hypothetical protein
MAFLKEDLTSQHYTWTDQGQTMFTGHPSRRIFDRFNGDQVLFIINFYGSLAEKFTIQEGRLLEDLIFNQLPTDAKSEMAVFNWLRGLSYSSATDQHLEKQK